MSEARTMTVHILGQEYRIRSTESGEFVREVALYVDELMSRISSRMTSGTNAQVAVLAALNIAEELHRERRAPSQPGPEVEARLQGLSNRVEEIIQLADVDEKSPASRSATG